MEELEEMEDFKKELAKLPTLDAIYPLLEAEANSKNLQIFIFDNEELKEHFTPRSKDIGMVTLSKNKDNALWNIKNYKHSYLIRLVNIDAEA